jgi:hypothetical protein
VGAAVYAYVVRGHLHPFLEVGQQGHDAAVSRRDGVASDVWHVVLVLRGRLGAVMVGAMQRASSSRRGSSRRGAHRVALGFLLCMAADGLFLSVVVERHLDGCLLRRDGRVVLGRARHGGLGCGACDGPGRSVVCLGESARGLARYDHDLPHQRAPECRHPHSQYHGRRAICNPCSHHGNVRDRRPIKHSFRT